MYPTQAEINAERQQNLINTIKLRAKYSDKLASIYKTENDNKELLNAISTMPKQTIEDFVISVNDPAQDKTPDNIVIRINNFLNKYADLPTSKQIYYLLDAEFETDELNFLLVLQAELEDYFKKHISKGITVSEFASLISYWLKSKITTEKQKDNRPTPKLIIQQHENDKEVFKLATAIENEVPKLEKLVLDYDALHDKYNKLGYDVTRNYDDTHVVLNKGEKIKGVYTGKKKVRLPSIENALNKQSIALLKERIIIQQLQDKINNITGRSDKLIDFDVNNYQLHNSNTPLKITNINTSLKKPKSTPLINNKTTPLINKKSTLLLKNKKSTPLENTNSNSPLINTNSNSPMENTNSNTPIAISGTGLKRTHYKKNIKFMVGSGALSKTQKEYVRIGKYMINITDLKHNMLSCKYVADRNTLPKLPMQRISNDVKNIILKIVVDNEFDKNEFIKLDNEDKNILINFVDACHLDIEIANENTFQMQYDVLLGEYKAGNNAILPKLKSFITSAIMNKMIAQKQGLLMLNSL